MIQRPPTTIRCKECSHALSSRAKKCPLCGCPVENNREKNVLPLRWLLVIAAIVIPAIVILIFIVVGDRTTRQVLYRAAPKAQRTRQVPKSATLKAGGKPRSTRVALKAWPEPTSWRLSSRLETKK